MEMQEIKSLIDKQGESFEAFKATLDEMKSADAVTEEKLARIEKDLDAAVEAKAALEAKIAAEAKEREDLELRIARAGGSADEAKAKAALDAFNLAIKSVDPRAADVTADDFSEAQKAHVRYLRKGKDPLTDAERKALSVGSDPDGGYLVMPDTSGRIIKKVFETSPIRQIAGQITISTDKLEGLEDRDEASCGWVGETESRTETSTPQLGNYEIPVHEVYAEPKATQKLLDDAAIDIEGWLADKVADKFTRTENTAFVTGNGVRKPKGFAAYDVAADSGSGVAWGKIGYVATGAAGAFASSNPADKIFNLIGTVKDAYLNGSRFVTRRSVITKIRQFKASDGQYLWQPALTAGNPETLAGYPITRAEDLAALADGSLSMYFGNFSEAYLIVDRIGIRVLRDPYTTKGYVKFYSTKRVGGGMVDFEAIKAMKFATS